MESQTLNKLRVLKEKDVYRTLIKNRILDATYRNFRVVLKIHFIIVHGGRMRGLHSSEGFVVEYSETV